MTTSYRRRIAENSEDLIAQANYMIVKSQADGNLTFDGHSKSLDELDNESRCRNLCARIERALQTCREEEIPGLLEMYDLLYRIGYGKMPDQRFMADQRQRVYVAWRTGNRNIQESQIYGILKKATNGDALRAKMLKNWVRTLCKHNYFPNVTTYENYQRLALVMRAKVDNVLKRKWYEANKVEDLSTLSTPLLKSYRSFVNVLFPVVVDYEAQQELDYDIVDSLLNRPCLNPYDRKALELFLVDR